MHAQQAKLAWLPHKNVTQRKARFPLIKMLLWGWAHNLCTDSTPLRHLRQHKKKTGAPRTRTWYQQAEQKGSCAFSSLSTCNFSCWDFTLPSFLSILSGDTHQRNTKKGVKDGIFSFWNLVVCKYIPKGLGSQGFQINHKGRHKLLCMEGATDNPT